MDDKSAVSTSDVETRLAQFTLTQALLQRRSRRFGKGMALNGGLIPYGGTFMTFSDYMRPAIRLACLSEVQIIYVFTHDSIGLGEDGPTHQPIEHLAALRAIPHLFVVRPADVHEVREAWRLAIMRRQAPTALALLLMRKTAIKKFRKSETYLLKTTWK